MSRRIWVSLIFGLGVVAVERLGLWVLRLRYSVIDYGLVSRRPRSDLPRGESYAPERVINQKLKRRPARRAERLPGP